MLWCDRDLNMSKYNSGGSAAQPNNMLKKELTKTSKLENEK